ncbi:helix-turn-helix domain-containing protein [Candidatus Poribacteria bacterium]|nr:helix-turn-helix domain-containing protein [Candidatus Poribacteria bacterium]
MAIDKGTAEHEKYYTVKEISKMLKIHEETVRRAIRDGRLESVRFGRDYRINHDNLMKFLAKKQFRIENRNPTHEKRGSFEALKEVFGTWQGDDADEIAELIMSTRTKTEF